MTMISLEKVSYKYRGKITAIKDLNLNIEKKEVIGLIGPNGAGKSTLAKLLSGFIKPSSGEIYLNGKNYKKSSIFDISKEVGYLFQNPDVMLCTSSIFDEVSIGLKRRELNQEELEKITLSILKFLGLYTIQKFHPRRLSQGEKKRVNLGFILASKPKIIILDEPFAGLDHHRKEILLSFFKKLKKDHVLILISHDLEALLEFCERIIILNEGKIVFDDAVSELQQNPDKLVEVGLEVPFFFKLKQELQKMNSIPSISTYEQLIEYIEANFKNAGRI